VGNTPSRRIDSTGPGGSKKTRRGWQCGEQPRLCPRLGNAPRA